jgi:hypothetical protein
MASRTGTGPKAEVLKDGMDSVWTISFCGNLPSAFHIASLQRQSFTGC